MTEPSSEPAAIFGAKPPGRLRLAGVRRSDGSDNLVVRYRLGPDAW